MDHYKIILTIACILVTSILVDLLFTTIIFRKTRSKLPDIWKLQSIKSYLAVLISGVTFSVFFVLMYLVFQYGLMEAKMIFVIIFGLLIWLSFYFPSLKIKEKPYSIINKKAVNVLVLNSILKVIIAAAIVFTFL